VKGIPADLAAKLAAMPGATSYGVRMPGERPVYETERDFQAAVIALAKRHAWLAYHTHDSRRSEAGFPDLVLLRGDVAIVAELKRSAKERPTAAQETWLEAWRAVKRIEVRLWTPELWTEIEGLITGRA
jgi:hypothetical protein